MKRIEIPNIYHFDNYRDFLSTMMKSNRASNSPLSFRFLAKKVNCSAGYLSDVVQGRSNLSLKKALDLADYLKFDSDEKTHTGLEQVQV